MSIYEAGYISVANGSNQVEGFGTYWLVYCKVGDTIVLDAVTYYIVAISDNHRLTLSANYSGAALDRSVYQIDIVTKPGQFYTFNISTLLWVSTPAAPVISGLVVTLGLKNIHLNWAVLDAVYGDLGYLTEVWHSASNSFGGATLLSTQLTTTFEHASLGIVANYYWLRVVQSAYSIVGATTASGSQTPLGIITADIATNAVTSQSYFADAGSIVGTGASAGMFAFNIDNTGNPHVMGVYITAAAEQVYSSGDKNTQWRILDITDLSAIVTIRETAVMASKVPLVSVSALYGIPANTSSNFVVMWYGQDSTVSTINRSVNAIGLKR